MGPGFCRAGPLADFLPSVGFCLNDVGTPAPSSPAPSARLLCNRWWKPTLPVVYIFANLDGFLSAWCSDLERSSVVIFALSWLLESGICSDARVTSFWARFGFRLAALITFVSFTGFRFFLAIGLVLLIGSTFFAVLWTGFKTISSMPISFFSKSVSSTSSWFDLYNWMIFCLFKIFGSCTLYSWAFFWNTSL